MDYDRAWKQLKEFVVKQLEENAEKADWTSVIEYSDLFIKMEEIESEVKYNDK